MEIKRLGADDYVLGLVNDKMSAWDIQKTLNRHKKMSNKTLSKIGKELGFGVHLCLNRARYSFATKQKMMDYLWQLFQMLWDTPIQQQLNII